MILLVRSCLIFSSWPPNKHSLSLSLSFSLSFSSNKITVLVDKKKTKNCLMFGVCVQTVERLGSKIYCVIKKRKESSRGTKQKLGGLFETNYSRKPMADNSTNRKWWGRKQTVKKYPKYPEMHSLMF